MNLPQRQGETSGELKGVPTRLLLLLLKEMTVAAVPFTFFSLLLLSSARPVEAEAATIRHQNTSNLLTVEAYPNVFRFQTQLICIFKQSMSYDNF